MPFVDTIVYVQACSVISDKIPSLRPSVIIAVPKSNYRETLSIITAILTEKLNRILVLDK